VDIPAKLRRAPAKTAAMAAGAAFMVLGGPKKLVRGARRAFLGPKANMPKSMLPKQIDKALGALGDDGNRVRGVIEREFASYLEQTAPQRNARDLRGTISALGGAVLTPITVQAGRRLAQELFRPDGGSFSDALARIRERRSGGAKAGSGAGSTAGSAVASTAGSKAAPTDAKPSKPSRWERRPARRNVLRPR
jgi:hypothetical protein